MDNPETPTEATTFKSTRRQVAFYPNMNTTNKPQKPFSRSAAKRESVMALGSIEHLQHHFTKTGIAAEKNPSEKPNNGMVPAIGGLQLKGKPFLQGIREFELPPSPTVPEIVQPSFPPYVKTLEIDPENLRPGVIEDLDAVEYSWWIRKKPQAADLLSVADTSVVKSGDPDSIDVLDVLKTTTRAVRSVRNYLMTLPQDDGVTPVQPQFRPNIFSGAPPKRQVSQPNSSSDPLSRIRASALEVLTVLRAVEESSRLPLTDDAYDAQSDHGEHLSVSGGSNSGSGTGSGSVGSHSRATSLDFVDADADGSVSVSYVKVGGRHMPVPVWDDEDGYDMNQLSEEEREKRERWDERLVLGGGWLYRQDVSRSELTKEREVIKRYLDAVDEVLFEGAVDEKRGWEREREKAERERRASRRRVSAGDAGDRGAERRRANRRVVSADMLGAMKNLAVTEEPEEIEGSLGDESVDDDDLPQWAQRAAYAENPLGRLHALLQAFLPSALHSLLPSECNRTALLHALSSGQLLCVAYNTGVRRSRKPWGFVNKYSIHDIAALEAQAAANEVERERAKRGWTFRRTDNLRLWSAALKLRYDLPVIMPNTSKPAKLTEGSTPTSSPARATQRFPTSEPPILFDAPLIARKEPGWEDMLEKLALRWSQSVVDERRGDR